VIAAISNPSGIFGARDSFGELPSFYSSAEIPPSGFFSESPALSEASLPVNILPDWLQVVAHFNPVTYALDAMRAALLVALLSLGCGVP